MVVAETAMWPFDPKDHLATTRNVVFQVAGAVYFVGFCLLVLAVFAAYLWQAAEAGRLGAAAMAAAVVGTMALGGDLWFESFAVPWLADEVPAAFDARPTVVLGLGALASYLSFAAGWALFGLASLRAGVFPRAICIAMAVSGVLGFRALLAPYGVPLGLTMVWLGIWMIRSGRRRPTRVS
jgi:hypothetical protein